jgi:hypothetical protein
MRIALRVERTDSVRDAARATSEAEVATATSNAASHVNLMVSPCRRASNEPDGLSEPLERLYWR